MRSRGFDGASSHRLFTAVVRVAPSCLTCDLSLLSLIAEFDILKGFGSVICYRR